MKPSTKNITKGAGREIKGKVNEAAGDLTGKTRLKAKGKLQGAAGHAQRKFGEAEQDAERDMEKEQK